MTSETLPAVTPVDYMQVPAGLWYRPAARTRDWGKIAEIFDGVTYPGARLFKQVWRTDVPVLMSLVVPDGAEVDWMAQTLARAYPPVVSPGTGAGDDGGVMWWVVPRIVADVVAYESDTSESAACSVTVHGGQPIPGTDDLVLMARLWTRPRNGERFASVYPVFSLLARLKGRVGPAAGNGFTGRQVLDVAEPLWDDTGRDYDAFPGCVDTALTVLAH
jgi:hypothetical protein